MSDEHVEAWSARPEGIGISLRREIACVYCCKRKRDRCQNCGGTGRVSLVYHLTEDEARTLLVEVGAALTAIG